MADIVTNTLQIGNDKLILRDADAQEKVTCLKEDLSESVGDLKNALNAVTNTTKKLIQTVTAASYYAKIKELSPNKTYLLTITTGGNATGASVQAGIDGSVSAMVDTLVPSYDFVASTPVVLSPYTPSQSGIIYIRLSNGTVGYTVSVEEYIKSEKLESDIEDIQGNIEEIEEDITELEEITEIKNATTEVQETLSPVQLTISNAGYYASGSSVQLEWMADTDRSIAIVPVESGTEYKLTTYIRSTVIAGLILIHASGTPVIGSNIPFTQKERLFVGDGTNQTVSGYEFTIPDWCNYIIVQSTNSTSPVLSVITSKTIVSKSYTKAESDERYAQSTQIGNPHMVVTRTIHVGNDEDKTATLGAGWSVNDGVYTHSPNGTGDLTFSFVGTVGAVYLVEFDTSYTGGEFVKVGIGTGYRVLAYNGTSHIAIALTAYDNTALYISLQTDGISREFSLSNITIRKIQDTGTEVTLSLNSVYTDNHNVAYGFWNVLLGGCAVNATANTRTIAIGQNALRDLQGGHRNVAIGTFAMSKMLGGENNIAIGSDSMYLAEHVDNNIAIGNWSLQHADDSYENTAVGIYAMEKAEGAIRNVAVGMLAGAKLVGTAGDVNKASKNTYVGYRAGHKNDVGGSNVAVGYDAQGGKGGNNNINIGDNSMMSDGISNAIAIGSGTQCTKNNQVVIGNSSSSEFVMGTKKIVFNQDGSVSWEAIS